MFNRLQCMQFLFYAWKNFIDLNVFHRNRDSFTTVFSSMTFDAFYDFNDTLSNVDHLQGIAKLYNKNPYMNIIKRSK